MHSDIEFVDKKQIKNYFFSCGSRVLLQENAERKGEGFDCPASQVMINFHKNRLSRLQTWSPSVFRLICHMNTIAPYPAKTRQHSEWYKNIQRVLSSHVKKISFKQSKVWQKAQVVEKRDGVQLPRGRADQQGGQGRETGARLQNMWTRWCRYWQDFLCRKTLLF